MRLPTIRFSNSDHEERKPKPKIFCNTCHVKLSTGMFGNRAIEYEDGYYCDACHFQKIKARKEEQKRKEDDNPTQTTD